MLEVSELSAELAGVPVLRSIAFEISDGSLCGLVGRNGAGKTSLMRAIMGVVPAQSGRIFLDGQDISALSPYQRARLGIGYMPEDRKLVPGMSASDNILLPAESMRIPDSRARLDHILSLIPEIGAFRHTPATRLSGGQQKLVALARALMAGRRLLLLDEPTEGVAPSLVQRFMEILRDLRNLGPSILVSDSNERHLSGIVDHMLLIERGTVTARREE